MYHFELKKGFFELSLQAGALAHGINKVRIVFMDCDTYSSAKLAFEYVSPVMQEGAYIILDDFFSYRGSKSKGVARAFNEFLETAGISARRVMDYGMGGQGGLRFDPRKGAIDAVHGIFDAIGTHKACRIPILPRRGKGLPPPVDK